MTRPARLEVASASKVGAHLQRLRAYLAGEPVFPVTLELDLTSLCSRACAECPSTSGLQRYTLSLPFLDCLLGSLGGSTTGLLLTGGEPTMAPLFSTALAMAIDRGFSEIAVVTNGNRLGDPRVAQALLTYASTIRLSLYDWDGGSCDGIEPALRSIEALRALIDAEGSRLRIGVSALTSADRADMLGQIAERVRSAGAHWMYFHPLCSRWGRGSPVLDAQDGVFQTLERLMASNTGEFGVYTFADRYRLHYLSWDSYHASHFLLVVGADGKNYLGPEVKYQDDYVIADLGDGLRDGFLWRRERLARVNSHRSRTYAPLQSRHRGILYNHFIEGLQVGGHASMSALEDLSRARFLFPHIL